MILYYFVVGLHYHVVELSYFLTVLHWYTVIGLHIAMKKTTSTFIAINYQ